MTKPTRALLLLSFALLAGCDAEGDSDDAAGIPECEQYFRRAEACFAKNPVVKATLGDGVGEVKDMLHPKGGQPLERWKMADVCKQRMAALAASCH